jgi:hypothetical protein
MYSSLEFRQLKRCRKHIFLILIAFMLAGFIAAEQGARARVAGKTAHNATAAWKPRFHCVAFCYRLSVQNKKGSDLRCHTT